ncbi:ribonuclease H2 subunit C-like [Mya arenaria]|uniref:ribonuclease H2 subunit C-like n=1 Tax=Mya arenaria TaxID=6604 RepID=UPI0022DF3216|nr:ribonuclease H2 subunit C-like [Mya arenaria]
MSTKLKLPPSGSLNESDLHFIPVKIEYDGQAKVKSYFTTSIRETDEQNLSASLRGRPLNGSKFDVPSGYSGLLMTETHKPLIEGDDREITASRSFKGFRYWNLDQVPGQGDPLLQALTWIDIAKALHGPVDEDISDSQGSLKSEISM